VLSSTRRDAWCIASRWASEKNEYAPVLLFIGRIRPLSWKFCAFGAAPEASPISTQNTPIYRGLIPERLRRTHGFAPALSAPVRLQKDGLSYGLYRTVCTVHLPKVLSGIKPILRDEFFSMTFFTAGKEVCPIFTGHSITSAFIEISAGRE
jgi:hypothetical protein